MILSTPPPWTQWSGPAFLKICLHIGFAAAVFIFSGTLAAIATTEPHEKASESTTAATVVLAAILLSVFYAGFGFHHWTWWGQVLGVVGCIVGTGLAVHFSGRDDIGSGGAGDSDDRYDVI